MATLRYDGKFIAAPMYENLQCCRSERKIENEVNVMYSSLKDFTTLFKITTRYIYACVQRVFLALQVLS